MNAAHLHLILVHVPIVLAPIGILLYVLAKLRPNETLRVTSLASFVTAAVFTVAAFLVGEGAEDIVEGIAAISHDKVETHEDVASFALWATAALGAVSAFELIALAIKSKAERLFAIPVSGLAVVAVLSLAYAATTGGEIRHPEAFAGSGETRSFALAKQDGAPGSHVDSDFD